MNADRKALADLFARLHGVGVESATLDCPMCDGTGTRVSTNVACWFCGGSKVRPVSDWQGVVLRVVGEMMATDTPGITMGDVLTAAKRAGVY